MIEKLPVYFKNPHLLADLPKGSPVLAALSGGADSSLLLYLLAKLRQIEDFPLYAAHVNHNIRVESGEARRDELFCRRLCESLSIPLFVADVDVPRLARESRSGLEEQARKVRYEFFADVMKKNDIRILATAHNADDNLETQIFNLCRGCGTEGICGIPEVRALDALDGALIVRPILSAPKSEIIGACNTFGIEYVTDSTNFETDCTRNAIRNVIVPELERLFGSPQKNAARLSRAAREDSDRLNSEALEYLEGQRAIKLDDLISLHPSVAKRVIKLTFARISHSALEAVHVDDVLSLAARHTDVSVSLPDKKRAVALHGELFFEDDLPAKAPKPFFVKLSEGYTKVNDRFAVCIGRSDPAPEYADENGNVYKLYTSARVKNVKIEALFARGRAAGDQIRAGNMHKKVKKLLCDNKIDVREREFIPMICSESEIIYAPMCAVADDVRAGGQGGEYTVSIYKIN